MLRQLVALGHLAAEGEYNTLELTAASRAVLRGEVTMRLRVAAEAPARGGHHASARAATAPRARGKAPPRPLDSAGQERFAALKAWRAEVARAHNLPAYVIFHDATLADMAEQQPATLDDLEGISGVGAKKLEAYGADILKVLAADGGGGAAT